MSSLNEMPADIIAVICRSVHRNDRLNFITVNKRTLDIALRHVFQPWVWYLRIYEYPNLVQLGPQYFKVYAHVKYINLTMHITICGMFTALANGNLEYYRKWEAFAGNRWDTNYDECLLLRGLLDSKLNTPSKSILLLLENPRILTFGLQVARISLVRYALCHELVAKALVKIPEIIEYLQKKYDYPPEYCQLVGLLLSCQKHDVNKDAMTVFLGAIKLTQPEYVRLINRSLCPQNRPFITTVLRYTRTVDHATFRKIALGCDCDKHDTKWLLKSIVYEGKLHPKLNDNQTRQFRQILKQYNRNNWYYKHFFTSLITN